ncbi:uncharacterized protein [Miscanthus floridulus]|uniref:uncharacterized protein n=1 Tax=Miscanthus floridulus TaxID=154761 RepID=UPI00345857A7
MDLGPCVRLQADRAPRQARESPEVIEEIECEAPNTRDPPPQLFQTFVCHGDMMEVVEDEEELMKISKNHACQLKRAAPSIAENQRLCEYVETLEKMLAEAHTDQEKFQVEKMQLEAKNWELTNQLGDELDEAKKRAKTEARLAHDAKVEAENQALLEHEAKALAEKERDEALTVKKQLTKELNLIRTNSQGQFRDFELRLEAIKEKLKTISNGIKPMMDLIDQEVPDHN